mmetsp:Transcript_166347/g.534299  ORF Transcript_166347/g.534299 Transcript_166347/m.534299 type:complete len:225 (+) Transcript_166347:931-1605(+)
MRPLLPKDVHLLSEFGVLVAAMLQVRAGSLVVRPRPVADALGEATGAVGDPLQTRGRRLMPGLGPAADATDEAAQLGPPGRILARHARRRHRRAHSGSAAGAPSDALDQASRPPLQPLETAVHRAPDPGAPRRLRNRWRRTLGYPAASLREAALHHAPELGAPSLVRRCRRRGAAADGYRLRRRRHRPQEHAWRQMGGRGEARPRGDAGRDGLAPRGDPSRLPT